MCKTSFASNLVPTPLKTRFWKWAVRPYSQIQSPAEGARFYFYIKHISLFWWEFSFFSSRTLLMWFEVLFWRCIWKHKCEGDIYFRIFLFSWFHSKTYLNFEKKKKETFSMSMTKYKSSDVILSNITSKYIITKIKYGYNK